MIEPDGCGGAGVILSARAAPVPVRYFVRIACQAIFQKYRTAKSGSRPVATLTRTVKARPVQIQRRQVVER
jgi:hypothetical protein